MAAAGAPTSRCEGYFGVEDDQHTIRARARETASSTPHHRITVEWLGEPVETLEDLLRAGLRAVCVGINPALTSVAAGHYYQGRLGQQFFERLRTVGLLPRAPGWEDDLAFANGIGFTDVVKRPTASAAELSAEDFAHGRPLLEAKLAETRPKLVLFSFKATAEVLFGRFEGNGFVERELAGADVFVMPGPYARGDHVAKRLNELRAWVIQHAG
jgi:double-stranded uracil-DNA glycosylase